MVAEPLRMTTTTMPQTNRMERLADRTVKHPSFRIGLRRFGRRGILAQAEVRGVNTGKRLIFASTVLFDGVLLFS